MLRRLFSLAMLWVILHHLLRARPDPVTGAKMTTETIVIKDDPPTREDLLEKLHNVNEAAKKISRRGYVGLMSDEHKRRHADLDELITQLVGR